LRVDARPTCYSPCVGGCRSNDSVDSGSRRSICAARAHVGSERNQGSRRWVRPVVNIGVSGAHAQALRRCPRKSGKHQVRDFRDELLLSSAVQLRNRELITAQPPAPLHLPQRMCPAARQRRSRHGRRPNASCRSLTCLNPSMSRSISDQRLSCIDHKPQAVHQTPSVQQAG